MQLTHHTPAREGKSGDGDFPAAALMLMVLELRPGPWHRRCRPKSGDGDPKAGMPRIGDGDVPSRHCLGDVTGDVIGDDQPGM